MYFETFYFLFLSSILAYSAKWMVAALMRVARYLCWKEFVVAFFAVSLGAVVPEFFVGVSSALRGFPSLSLGNIVGQNIILFTLAPALCAFLLKNLEMESRTVKAGSTFAVAAAFLPFLLLLDGELSRTDGILLILLFLLYVFWLFSKRERFTKVYDNHEKGDVVEKFRGFLKDIFIITAGLVLVVLVSQGMINSAVSFAEKLAISLPLVGILIVSLGTGLPETYFAVTLARKGQSWMILGGLMGAVAVSSTLVLGIVALIHPIEILDFSPFAIARIFLITSALFFLFFVRTHRKITVREGLFLLAFYILFLMVEIITK